VIDVIKPIPSVTCATRDDRFFQESPVPLT
jgi:hypothetical protein